MKPRSLVLVIAVALLPWGASPSAQAPNYGTFVGSFAGAFLEPPGWRFRLSEDLAYIDPGSKRWIAPKDAIVDGASIPRVFWTPIGGPFEGEYRNASAVHDVACDKRSDPWQDVHRMFYFAMRAGGVSERKAGLMYAAVYKFGPRWQEPAGFWARLGGGIKGIFLPSGASPPPPPPPPITEEDVKALEALIESNQPGTPEEIERLLEPQR
jgi:hypothetical protein